MQIKKQTLLGSSCSSLLYINVVLEKNLFGIAIEGSTEMLMEISFSVFKTFTNPFDQYNENNNAPHQLRIITKIMLLPAGPMFSLK